MSGFQGLLGAVWRCLLLLAEPVEGDAAELGRSADFGVGRADLVELDGEAGLLVAAELPVFVDALESEREVGEFVPAQVTLGGGVVDELGAVAFGVADDSARVGRSMLISTRPSSLAQRLV